MPLLERALRWVEEASARGLQLGATRYRACWIQFESEPWRRHFQSWSTLARVKRIYDPERIMSPGSLPFGSASAGPLGGSAERSR